MLTLRLEPGQENSNRAGGEIHACAYAADGRYLISGGWDGHLRKWDAGDGSETAAIKVSDKPVSACAVAVDGASWLSGSLEGLLSTWDAKDHSRQGVFLAHSRPISGLVFGPDERVLATTSWDRQIILWDVSREREGRPLTGHRDIVAGCRFMPSGQLLISWSYDGTMRFWDVGRARQMSEIAAHSDRVTAGDVSPDGRLVITGSRNGTLKLWDVQTQALMQHTDLESEICACFFLLDGESLVTATTDGHLRLYNAPELDFSTELATGLTVHSAALAPTGEQLALGCGDGRVHFVAIDGTAEVPLLVRVTQTERRTASPLQRLLGRSKLTSAWVCKCPLCRQTFELSKGTPGQPAPCPHCRRKLRVGAVAVAAQT